MAFITIRGLKRYFQMGDTTVKARHGIDLDVAEVSDQQIAAAEDLANRVIQENRPVRARTEVIVLHTTEGPAIGALAKGPAVLPLLLVLAAFITPTVISIALIIGLTSWMEVARIIRAQIQYVKEQDFVQAAFALGASEMRIMFKELLPNAIAPVLVSATIGIATVAPLSGNDRVRVPG